MKEQMDQSLWSTFREVELGDCDALIAPAEPTEAFDLWEPLFKEVQQVVKKVRAGSAPSPSCTNYLQTLPSTSPAAVEHLQGHLEESAQAMEVHKWSVESERRELREHQPV